MGSQTENHSCPKRHEYIMQFFPPTCTADTFQKLSKAYSILTDPAAKVVANSLLVCVAIWQWLMLCAQAAYDKWLKAKHAAKKRHEELSAKRKKLKESMSIQC